MRSATVQRKTKETNISVTLQIDGSGNYSVSTGIGFLDHMLELFARHGMFDIQLKCKGDLRVDDHHTTEDVAIALGQAFGKALKERAGIARYGSAYVPMDESLAGVSSTSAAVRRWSSKPSSTGKTSATCRLK